MLGVTVPVHRGDDLAWLEINAVPVVIPGEPETPVVVSSYRDVTARYAADEAIRFQAELLDTAGQAIVAVDGEGVITYWNKHAEHMYGWSAPEAVGQSLADLILPEETVARGEIIVEAMQSGVTSSDDHWVRRRDRDPVPGVRNEHADARRRGTAVGDDHGRHRHHGPQARRAGGPSPLRDRRVFDRRDHRNDPRSRHHHLERWRDDPFRIPRRRGSRPEPRFLAPSGPDELLATLDAAAPRSFADVETRCRIKGGALVRISLSISPINDEDGQAIGLSRNRTRHHPACRPRADRGAQPRAAPRRPAPRRTRGDRARGRRIGPTGPRQSSCRG